MVSLDVQFAVAGGGAHADLHDGAGLVDEFAVAQIAHAAGFECRVAGVADAHAAAVGRVEPGVLGDAQQVGLAVRVHVQLALREADLTAGGVVGDRRQLGAEPFDVQAVGQAGLFPGFFQGGQQARRATGVAVALAPVRTDLLQLFAAEVGGVIVYFLGVNFVQVVMTLLLVELAQFLAKNSIELVRGVMEVHRVRQALLLDQAVQHASRRRNATAGGDEQRLDR